MPCGTGCTFTTGGIANGFHANHEIFYPSIDNWVRYDAQGTVHFGSTNFIEIDHVADNSESSLSMQYAVGDLNNPPVFNLSKTSNTSIGTVNPNYVFHNWTSFNGTNHQYSLIAGNNACTPVAVGDEVEITYPSNGSIIKVGELFNFNADFDSYEGNTWATSWDWKIELYHSGGSYLYLEPDRGGVYSGYFSSSWQEEAVKNVPCYNWARDFNGNIRGKVTAIAHINDGGATGDEIDIALNDEVTYIQNRNFRGSWTVAGRNILIGSDVNPNETQGPVTITNGAFVIDACDTVTIMNNFTVDTDIYGATLEIK